MEIINGPVASKEKLKELPLPVGMLKRLVNCKGQYGEEFGDLFGVFLDVAESGELKHMLEYKKKNKDRV